MIYLQVIGTIASIFMFVVFVAQDNYNTRMDMLKGWFVAVVQASLPTCALIFIWSF